MTAPPPGGSLSGMAKKKTKKASDAPEVDLTQGGEPIAVADEPVELAATDDRAQLLARIDEYLDSPAGAIGRRMGSRQEQGTAIELLRAARDLLR